jgi:hypothetical protein
VHIQCVTNCWNQVFSYCLCCLHLQQPLLGLLRFVLKLVTSSSGIRQRARAGVVAVQCEGADLRAMDDCETLMQ